MKKTWHWKEVNKLEFLSIDIGTSSGKAFIISYDGKKIDTKKILRFPNIPVEINGFTYWNILELYQNILTSIKVALEKYNIFSVGIDTWGVDFGLLDENGFLVGLPLHYRNSFKWNAMERVLKDIGKKWIFDRSPTQFQPFNTLYQLIGMKDMGFKAIDISKTLLGIPSLFVYFLTGKKFMEFTFATTTQIFNPSLNDWDPEIVEKLNIPQILPKIVKPATIVDEVKLFGKRTKVVFPATHDTGSAFACVSERDSMIISTGTWFLEGILVEKAFKNEEVMKYNFANEGCLNGKYRLLSNVTGMWLIENLRSKWDGMPYKSFIEMAMDSKPFAGFIDVDSKELQNTNDMEEAILSESMKFSNKQIKSRGEISRTIFEGIALKTRWIKERLESASHTKMKKIRMLGGATRNEMICQFIANSTGLPVEAGPIEATAIGNGLAQIVASGELSLDNISNLVERSFEIKRYEPHDVNLWNHAYEEFSVLMEKAKEHNREGRKK